MKLYGQILHTGDSIQLPDGSQTICTASSFDKTEAKTPQIKELPNGKLKANLNELFDYYKGFLLNDILFRNTDSDGYVIFTKGEYFEMHNNHTAYQNKMFKLNRSVELNNKGIELEKRGKINAAISIYEQNIEDDCYPALHSFNRLLVLYRKSKNYQDEKRVCLKAIQVFFDTTLVDKFKDRLEKINKLISKSM